MIISLLKRKSRKLFTSAINEVQSIPLFVMCLLILRKFTSIDIVKRAHYWFTQCI